MWYKVYYFNIRIPFSISFQPPISLSEYTGANIPPNYRNSKAAILNENQYEYNKYIKIKGDFNKQYLSKCKDNEDKILTFEISPSYLLNSDNTPKYLF